MEAVTKRILHQEERNDVEEQIRLLKEDVDEPNLSHGKAMHALPDWFDEDKFRRGQKFFHDNYFALFVSKLCGLLVILSIPRVLKVLIMTQRSSSPGTAFKRYVSTLHHMLMWYNGDITDKSSCAYKSLREVHAKHTAANKRGLSEKVGSLSQSSLAITQFGFMGFGLLVPEKLGIKVGNEKDLEGFVHFWRTIGYLIGVDDRYNICRGTVEETKETCRRLLNEILWPYLKTPAKEFSEMSITLLQGMWAMVPFIDVEAFTAFTYDVAGLDHQPFTNWWSRLIFIYQKLAHQMLRYWVFGDIWRFILNKNVRFSVFLATNYPLLAHWYFKLPITDSKTY